MLLYIALGLTAGVLSGLLGLGGGIILVPALVYIFGLNQHLAQGTTLALMIPPIGLLAVMKYYKEGNVKFGIAALICLGFLFGGLLGAHFAHNIDGLILRRIFGIFMFAVSIKMIFF